MADQVKDDSNAAAEASPLFAELPGSFSAGNILDKKAPGSNDQRQSQLNELLFSSQITATEGFIKPPYPEQKAEFKPYTAPEPSLVENQVELPREVPIPRPRPDNLTRESDSAPETSIRPKARPEELGAKQQPLESVPIPKPRPSDLDTAYTIRPKPRPLNKEQKAVLQELTGFRYNNPDGTPFGEGMQAAKEVTQDFVKEPNTATALPKYKERFEQAIQTSDQAYFAVEKTQAPVIAAAELQYGMAITRITDSYIQLDKEIGKLPADAQIQANNLKLALQTPGQSESARQTFANDFKDYPQFVAATQKWLDDSATFRQADAELSAARKPLVDAARDEALTRFVYKRAADLAGNKNLAASVGEEALLMARRAVEIEQKEKPKAAQTTGA
ncbi:MAG: hypothetical protein QG574_790 [Cyanobacteriota bacterium erpe_2018_sw_21hr_WHONDRS-SW48-000092_B_bin.40]|nr:hypothetical protein [Cyanobacteriota bacterium erpe_2018_sw_21hr_WHONDRS-SW48-000092_B_bin.40]